MPKEPKGLTDKQKAKANEIKKEITSEVLGERANSVSSDTISSNSVPVSNNSVPKLNKYEHIVDNSASVGLNGVPGQHVVSDTTGGNAFLEGLTSVIKNTANMLGTGVNKLAQAAANTGSSSWFGGQDKKEAVVQDLKEQEAKNNEAILEDRDYRNTLKEEHPLQYHGGDFLTKSKLYGLAGAAAEASGALPALTGVVGEPVAKAIVGLAPDILLDTTQTEYENYLNGMRGMDLLKDTGVNIATNAAFNGATEYIPRLAKGAFNAITGKNATKAAEEVVENAAKSAPIDPLNLAKQNEQGIDALANQQKQATEALQNLSEQLPKQNTENVIKGKGNELADNMINQRINNAIDKADYQNTLDGLEKYEREVLDRANKYAANDPELQKLVKDYKGVANDSWKNLMGVDQQINPDMIKQHVGLLDEIEERAAKNVPMVDSPVGKIRADKAIPGFNDVSEESTAFLNSKKKLAENADNLPKIEMDAETYDKARSYMSQLYDGIESHGTGKYTFSEDAEKKYEQLKAAYNYYKEEIESANHANIMDAKRKVDNARKALDTALKKSDPNYDGFFNKSAFGKSIDNARNAIGMGGKADNVKVDKDGFIIPEETDLPMETNYAKPASEIQKESTEKGLKQLNKPEIPEQKPVKSIKDNVETPDTSKLPLDLQFFADKGKKIQQEYNGMADGAGKSKIGDALKKFWSKITGAKTKEEAEAAWKELETSVKRERGYVTSMREKTDLPKDFLQNFADQPELYNKISNQKTSDAAEDIFNNNTLEEAQAIYRGLLNKRDPRAVPLSDMINRKLIEKGRSEEAVMNIRDLAEKMTKSGQFTQAAVINLMKNDPMTAYQYAIKDLDKLNEQGAKKFGKKWKDFTLTRAEEDAFLKLKKGDKDGIAKLYDQIGERLGKEYPTTMLEKIMEGRKIAMLFNVRTNVRNTLANLPTAAMRSVSDRVEAVGQNIAHIINPDFKVTQSFTPANKEQTKLAQDVFKSDAVQNAINAFGGKYKDKTLKSSIVGDKQMYKNHWLDQKFDEGLRKITKAATGKELGISNLNEAITGKKDITNWLETVRNLTYKALDLGDSPFVKKNFESRLASYIKAQGIKSAEEIPNEAINLAIEEAMKATYKDNSWAVGLVKGLKDSIEKIPKVGKPVSDAIIPFVQAPANIAARMVDYSPIRGSKGIADIIKGAKEADQNVVRRGIEEVSKGLTGTGMVALGIALHNSGLITGSYSNDKDQAAFEKQNGFKEYALHLGDKYFTYDWMQPAAEGLIVGTLLADAVKKSDEYESDLLKYLGVSKDSKVGKAAHIGLGVGAEGAKASVNSWFNASPIQSLADLFKGNAAQNTDIATNLWKTTVEDFAGSFVPATVNATAKTADVYTRNTKDYSSNMASFVNSQKAKIPGLSKTLPIKYDTWGRPIKYNGGTVPYTNIKYGANTEAALAKFLIPGDYSTDKTDALDKEINRLYDKTGNAAVFPHQMGSSDANIGDRKLNNAEMSQYQKDTGKFSRELADAFTKSPKYKNLSDEEKANTMSKFFKYAKNKAATKFGKELDNDYTKMEAAYKEKGVDGVLDEVFYKAELKKQGVNDSKGVREAYEKGGTTGLNQYLIKKKDEEYRKQAAEKKMFSDAGISSGSPEDIQKELASYGAIDSKKTVEYYAHARKTIPSLTTKEYANTLHKIGGSDYKITQDEMLNYFNNNSLSESQINTYWNAYGNWKTVPKLKKGVWKASKK